MSFYRDTILDFWRSFSYCNYYILSSSLEFADVNVLHIFCNSDTLNSSINLFLCRSPFYSSSLYDPYGVYMHTGREPYLCMGVWSNWSTKLPPSSDYESLAFLFFFYSFYSSEWFDKLSGSLNYFFGL